MPPGGHADQIVNPVADRIRVGVVAVVHNRKPGAAKGLAPSADIVEGRDSVRDLPVIEAEKHSHRRRRKRRIDIMLSKGGNPHRNPSQTADDVTGLLFSGFQVLRPNVTVRAEAVGDFSLMALQRTKLFVVSVDNHRSRFGHRLQHLGLRPEHPVQVMKKLKMGMPDGGIDGKGRPDHSGQAAHLAEFRNSHLDHGRFVLASEFRQHHGNSVAVVQVSFCLEGAETLLQDRGDHFLCRGLAHASGDADNRQVKIAAVSGGNLFQCRQHIVHNDHWPLLPLGYPLTDAAGSAAFKRGRDKVMPVHALSPKGREQVSFLKGTGVNHDFSDFGLRVAGSAKPSAAERGGTSDGHMFHL